MSKLAFFLSRVDRGDPAAIGICLLAILIFYGIVRALILGAEQRRFERETKRRRNGYSHMLKRVEPPAPLRAVPNWPPITHRDSWTPSADEREGRAS